jgi:hypothetical protein
MPVEREPQMPKYSLSPFPVPDKKPESTMLSRSTTTVSQQTDFRKEVMRDCAILCDTAGASVTYAQRAEDGDYEMVPAASECQVMILRKRTPQSDGSVRYITSIWAFSNDRSVRLQQKLGDGVEIVPYTVWGAPKKVALRVYSLLKFFGVSPDSMPVDTAQTNWVTYEFNDEDSSTRFQSELMGKNLVLNVQTNKTLRVHDNIVVDTFKYQEQMCGLENLRLWQDRDSNGVLCMIHFRPQFRDGYLAFYINSSRDRIRVTEQDKNVVKLKGIFVPVEDKKSKHRRISSSGEAPQGRRPSKPKSLVTCAKIEFSTERDKHLFVDKLREAQGLFFAG